MTVIYAKNADEVEECYVVVRNASFRDIRAWSVFHVGDGWSATAIKHDQDVTGNTAIMMNQTDDQTAGDIVGHHIIGTQSIDLRLP